MIKLKDLRRIAEFYALALPGWRVMGKKMLVRDSGPVLQGILLERKSYDDIFTLLGFAHVLIVPCEEIEFGLAYSLAYRNGAPGRSVHIKNYERERDEIIPEIIRQMVPRVDRPLDPRDVLRQYEALGKWRSWEAEYTAALHAYFGNDWRARRWCRRARRQLPLDRETFGDRDFLKPDFLDALEGWLDKGQARARLDEFLQSQRLKFGLNE